LSKSIESATSSPSVATDISDPSNVDLEDAGTGPSRVFNVSKKRKADAVDDSVPTSSVSRAGSDSETPQGKRKKSKEEKIRRKKSKKKVKYEDKEHTRI
jgi:hypothetical protein